MRANFKYWVPVILWMAFIFLMSTDSFSSENTSVVIKPIIQFVLPATAPATVDKIHSVIRKCAHITEYFILGVLLFRAFCGGSEDNKSWQWAGLSLIVIILYAASDEIHQSFISTRSASPIDVGIDTIGGMFAQIAGITWQSCKKKTQ